MNKKVLIIDDDPVNLALMQSIMESFTYSVFAFSSPRKAIEELKTNTYDLVILDKAMPELDGLALTREIRNIYNDDIVIVMMTGHDELRILDEALKTGVDDYLVKPISKNTFSYRLHIIENQIKKMHERVHYQRELLKSQEHYKAIFHNSSIGVLILNTRGFIVEYNETLSKITGFIDITLRDKFIIHCIHKNEIEGLKAFFKNLLEQFQEYATIETRILSRSGLELICKISARVVKTANEAPESFIIVLIDDITEKVKFEEELKFNAFHDPLTKLPNRDLFNDRLNKILLKDEASLVQKFSVLILDIDRFQIINETLGHSKGDTLIKHIANRLHAIMQPGDTLARLTGDEFGMLTEKLSGIAELTHFISSIQNMFKEPFIIDENEITITTSIGIKVYEGGEELTSNILRDADTALHRAKSNGPNSYSFFIQKMTLESNQALKLENDMRKAIDNQEFQLYYQPQLDLVSNKIIGVEALLRWEHAEIGFIPPAKFIPLAESAGLIHSLGYIVFLKAIDKCLEWESMGVYPVKIAVNVSPVQFKDKKLISLIAEKTKKLANCRNSLQVELTESVLMENPKEAVQTIVEMRKRGVDLAIDDFGTGYSSLSYLKSLPISILKIDKSFVDNLATNDSDRSIVMAIISMAHSMKIKAVAEGVETNEQLTLLKTMFCDIVQGYYISRPLSEKNLMEFIHQNTGKDLQISHNNF
jgi:diguanylate cyclase (GGDEF)-like protein/PAS domain S-box-containing protein